MNEIKGDVELPKKVKLVERDTTHENTISLIRPLKRSIDGEPQESVCTADNNGNLLFWKI